MTTEDKVEQPVTQETTETTVPIEGQETKVVARGPDYQKVIGLLQTENASLKQALANNEGSVRKQAELEALIVRNNQLTELAIAQLIDPDAEPSTLAAKVQEVKKQGDVALATQYIQQVRDGYFADIVDGLIELGFKNETEDPRFEEGRRLWTEADRGKNLVGYHKAFRAINRVLNTIRKEQGSRAMEQKTKEAEQRFKVENGLLAPATAPGTPGGAGSLASYVQGLRKGNALPSAAEIDRLTAEYLRGG